ncbi:DoxX family protein [Deinococcus cellulosilyticus]|uniref:Quinol oxidase n=1 Tax=Deinococcus cellulosilyticus (strain DSM 18568 / NBRC 106333 / KACC 11606 / 5516J-15) TaxID=1223518 RepID=A0A511N6N6_DEIC1|nr:DoxX family protein [Deinococcus cellulosilyticus]GEM48504.1 quinol oxidase [Deinococcus cellulosilyticus NBRC 106333 = KACC 11606]
MNEQNLQRFQLALTVLRVLIGIIFMAHGYQKFFEYTIPGTTGAFGQMGVPLAGVIAPVVATLELVGGLALVTGFLTRITAGLLALNMLGAMVLVHLKGGFFAPNGIELPLSLMASTVALALGGAGAFALDGLRKREQQVVRA